MDGNSCFGLFTEHSMTQAEMACCKKMAGDCRMGMGQHPCCKTKVERATPVATLDRSAIRIHPSFVAASLAVRFSPEPTIERAGSNELRGLPPPAPPALHPSTAMIAGKVLVTNGRAVLQVSGSDEILELIPEPSATPFMTSFDGKSVLVDGTIPEAGKGKLPGSIRYRSMKEDDSK